MARVRFKPSILSRLAIGSKAAQTADLLERTGEMAKVGGWELDLVTTQVTFSKEAARIHELDYPYTPPTLSQGNEYYPPEAWPIIQAAVQAAIERGIAYDLESPFITAKGRPLWVRVQGFAVRENGKTVKLRGTFQDITERRKAEDALRLHSAMLESLDEGIVMTSVRDGLIRYANPRFEQLFGYPAGGLDGKPVAILNARGVKDPEAQAREIMAVLERDGRWEGELLNQRLDGSTFWCSARVTTFVHPDLGPVWIASHQDVTRRKLSESALLESNQRLLFATGSGRLGVWDWDLVTGAITWNDRMFELYGASRTEIHGTVQDWKDGLHPEDREAAVAECEAAIRGETRFDTEFRVRHRDGTILWLKADALVLRDDQGNPVRMIGLNRDITDLKKAESLLRDERQRLRTILNTVEDPIFVKDNEHRIVLANRAFFDIFALEEDSTIERTLAEHVPEDERKQFLAVDRKVLDTGISDVREESLTTGNIARTIITRKARFLDHTGQRFLVGSIHDITEHKKAEKDRSRLQDQLHQVQKMDSLGNLAGGVAHDINNVLGAIMALAAVHTRKAPEGSSLRSDMETISKACKRGGSLVKGLLSFARQELAEKREVDLNRIVLDTVTLLQRATLQKVQVKTDLAEDLDRVMGDPAALSHSLMNLCVNAVDAMPEGGTLTLVTLMERDGSVVLEVADTGTGMPKEVLDKALEPFFTTKPQGKGTGLGLSIVYNTLKTHGGMTEIHSIPGSGTRVSLRFPSSGKSRLAEFPVGRPLRAGRPLNLLVVDDDELIQSSFILLLQSLGHSATLAPGGQEALRLLQSGQALDAVILDMNMPGMDGVETFGRMRVMYPDLPIILTTGRADQRALDLVRGNQAVALLPKPFTEDDLNRALQNLGMD